MKSLFGIFLGICVSLVLAVLLTFFMCTIERCADLESAGWFLLFIVVSPIVLFVSNELLVKKNKSKTIVYFSAIAIFIFLIFLSSRVLRYDSLLILLVIFLAGIVGYYFYSNKKNNGKSCDVSSSTWHRPLVFMPMWLL